MRIAHFIHRYPPALGGSEAYFARLSEYLAARGDQVRVCTSNALDLEAFWSPAARTLPAGTETRAGVEVRRHTIRHWPGRRYHLKALSLIPWPRLQARTLPCNPILPQLWKACGRPWDIDIVHASAFPYTYPILCALRLAQASGAPLLLTPFLHLGDPQNKRDRTRRSYLAPPMLYLLRHADLIFVQTELEREALLRAGLQAGRLELLGMGVDSAECTGGDGPAARRRWGLPAEAAVVGHLANQSVEKGTVDLLEAAARLWSRGEFFRVLLAGPEMPNFQKYWESCPFKANVVRLGVVSDADRRDFYAACDLFAMPSRSDSFGIVFLEAWANGLPCLAYRAGGVAEVIRHGEDGLLAECGDLEGLAGHLRTLLQDRQLRQQLGLAGRERTERKHRWEPLLAKVRGHYQRLVDATTSDAQAAARELGRRRQPTHEA